MKYKIKTFTLRSTAIFALILGLSLGQPGTVHANIANAPNVSGLEEALTELSTTLPSQFPSQITAQVPTDITQAPTESNLDPDNNAFVELPKDVLGTIIGYNMGAAIPLKQTCQKMSGKIDEDLILSGVRGWAVDTFIDMATKAGAYKELTDGNGTVHTAESLMWEDLNRLLEDFLTNVVAIKALKDQFDARVETQTSFFAYLKGMMETMILFTVDYTASNPQTRLFYKSPGRKLVFVPSSIKRLVQLRYVDFSGCSIRANSESTFAGLGALEDLRFRDNNLRSIEPDNFAMLGSLKKLSLDSNQITNIKPGTFTGFGPLISLHLCLNKIKIILAGSFVGLGALETLTLRSNEITNLESGAFIGLDSLVEVELSENKITTLGSGAFTGLGALGVLDLSGNKITTFETGAFTGLGALESL